MKNESDALAKKNLTLLGILLGLVVLLFFITLVKLGGPPPAN